MFGFVRNVDGIVEVLKLEWFVDAWMVEMPNRLNLLFNFFLINYEKTVYTIGTSFIILIRRIFSKEFSPNLL